MIIEGMQKVRPGSPVMAVAFEEPQPRDGDGPTGPTGATANIH
jgi:hypothetical protein